LTSGYKKFYLRIKIAKNSYIIKRNVITATVEAIKDYFNATLSTKLLYRFERAQFNEVKIEYF
jgi:hypothetical protein